MELIVTAAVIAVTAAILTLLIKKTNPELSAGLALAACCLILTMAMKLFSSVKEVLELAAGEEGFVSMYAAPVFKCAGIGITSRLACDICKDSGQTALASAADICGAICAAYVALPLVKTLLRMIGEFT